MITTRNPSFDKPKNTVRIFHRYRTPHLPTNIVLDTQNRDSYTVLRKIVIPALCL